mmetsp:Transcript_7889/g.14271  ORF Transcript_7889/g.14271 Transcript_7889/m.14271 type:complete len:118 (-) Transcript_7889:1621-1974(-)|eukprot:CAMPEP_0201600024 /NCGR_PEP_ID=MMETSP0492-20130828/1262_1 /ASSEMBLY_ACC=CAM_ASM_000837 /TAXON_ID=420259 /ORGANISM="Thalassiosira gravida, Strain GMp14c1" /LENGTH=117 /DNA_ID=CAMNT_0048062717 /DNA_START=37 /DNA_END=390 /DNA_ORIENTATION=+
MARLSGLQKDVLALYRSILREAVRKDRKALPSSTPPPSSSSNNNVEINNRSISHPPFGQLLSISSSTAYARDQFRKEALVVRRSDFKRVEYKIRKGKKQLELLKMPGVDLVGGASGR